MEQRFVAGRLLNNAILPAMLLGFVASVRAQEPLAPLAPVAPTAAEFTEFAAPQPAAVPFVAAPLTYDGAAPPAVRPPSPDAAALQQQLDGLRQEVDALRQAEQERQEKAKAASSSSDSKPTFRISPELQLDNYFFAQSAASRATVGDMPDGAAFRRARVAVLGDYKITEYRLEMDFAQPGRPTFLDVWGAVNELPVVGQLKIGNFFEPIGLERLTSNRFAPFMERNLPDQPFDPQRSPGAALQNTHSNNHGLWTLGVFRPRSDNWGSGVSDTGDWAVDGRLTWLPYYDEESDGRYYMHVGTAHSYRRTVDHQISFRAEPEARVGAADPNVPFFVDTGTIIAGEYGLHEVEFACSMGSVYVQAEYFWTPVYQLGGPRLDFTGWYAQAGWFLTGEHRPFRRETATFDRVQPFNEFFRVRTRQGIGQGSGAWEVAIRLSQLDLTDENIGGGTLTDLTVGLNWYLTPYMRMTANYIHAFLDPATGGNVGADIFGTRMQYDF
ncbi:MAG: porin [Pirellulales bacterium]